jgi:hypothetical protein
LLPAKIDIGTVAALGVAVGGITAALGAIINAILGLKFWMPVGFIAIILLISGVDDRGRDQAAATERRACSTPDGWALSTSADQLAVRALAHEMRKLPPGAEHNTRSVRGRPGWRSWRC